MHKKPNQVHVTLLAIPDVMASTLMGLYDVLNSFSLLSSYDDALPRANPFTVEIAASKRGRIWAAGRTPLEAARAIDAIDSTDVVIVPSVMVEGGEWRTGRYLKEVKWLAAMHKRGATLCSACSGALLLAETGLLNDKEAAIHWTYAQTFRKHFPSVRLLPERALVASGEKQELVMSGASTSWHDLVLYLIARHAGPTAAQATAKFFALQWHAEGLSPFVVFEPVTDHGDAAIRTTQEWLSGHFSIGNPIEQAAHHSGLPMRSFKRRFKNATGHSPIDYVQRLRVEDAKRRLERTEAPVDEISWQVGYEEPAFFRRLFKRLTGLTAGSYRRRFRVPKSIHPGN